MTDPRSILKKLHMYERFKSLTKAIQMVAMSQLSSLNKKIVSRQEALSVFKPIWYKNGNLLKNQNHRILVCPISVDKSCCGPHNNNVFQSSRDLLSDLENKGVFIMCFGRRCKSTFKMTHRNCMVSNIRDFDRDTLSLSTSSFIYSECFPFYDELIIIFNRFITAFKQITSYYSVMSFNYYLNNVFFSSDHNFSKIFFGTSNVDGNLNLTHFLRDLYDYFISLLLLDVLEENEYSSLGARAIAMSNASNSAAEFVEELNLLYNKARQEQITTELLDIVTAVNFV